MLLAALLLCVQDAQDTALERTAQKLADRIAAEPDKPEDLFSADFLKVFPAPRVTALFKQLHSQYGACTSVEVVADESPSFGVVHLILDDRTRIAALINIQRDEPHKIVGLRFDPPRPARRSLDDVVDEMRQLRGKTSLALLRLGDRPLTLAEHGGDQPLAIGSTFKLYVLGALLSADRAKDRRWWSSAIELQEQHRSAGSGGVLDSWKQGTPLTLHSLASLMISRSDNTAADHLLFHVGRERVEAVAAEMGLRDPKRNRPFLSTLEAFKLKSSPDLRKQFVEADETGRRKILGGPVRELSRDAIEYAVTPAAIDKIEWFASTLELCQAMDWLRRKTEDAALVVGRDILAINAGLRYRKRSWKFVGFKGGSETGVLNATLLLQSAGGEWYAFSATWNDANSALDEAVFLDLAQDVVFLLQKK